MKNNWRHIVFLFSLQLIPQLFGWNSIHTQEVTKFYEIDTDYEIEDDDEIDLIQSMDMNYIELEEVENNEEDDINPDDFDKELKVKNKFINQVTTDYYLNNFSFKKRRLYLINCQFKIPYLSIV